MINLKKIISSALVFGMFANAPIQADEWISDSPGYGYEESSQASYLTPTIAIGALVIAAIIIVAVQDNGGHSSSHSHQ